MPTGFAPAIDFDREEFDWLRNLGRRTLTEATRIARLAEPSEDLEISTEVTLEPIAAELVHRSEHAYLLVVGSRGLGAVRRGLLGSVSTAAAHHAHCPVAVVHSSAADSIAAGKPILVGVDGTRNSEPALAFAFEEASRRKVGLVALHAWIDAGNPDILLPGWEAVRESAGVALSESLAGWSDKYPDVPVRRIVVRDRPAQSLPQESGSAQLVVVGSHGRGGFTGMLLGSTSNTLLHAVDCPIIVVRRARL
ncbi:universal stress protein [Nocardia sp. BMG51109]|uniref:universal stress protein n=1 Tax=Nocardia sp. BMG51109 TaxID=1056816 RepID=UPI001E39362C